MPLHRRQLKCSMYILASSVLDAVCVCAYLLLFCSASHVCASSLLARLHLTSSEGPLRVWSPLSSTSQTTLKVRTCAHIQLLSGGITYSFLHLLSSLCTDVPPFSPPRTPHMISLPPLTLSLPLPSFPCPFSPFRSLSSLPLPQAPIISLSPLLPHTPITSPSPPLPHTPITITSPSPPLPSLTHPSPSPHPHPPFTCLLR